MTDTKDRKHAVILSGGGANGAYEVGVLKALCAGMSPATDHKPLDPYVFSGTSVGAYNAAYLVSHWKEYGPSVIANLEQLWVDEISTRLSRCGNSMFRLRGDPREYLNPACYFPNPLQPLSYFVQDTATLGWEFLRRSVQFATDQEAPIVDRVASLFNFSSFVSTDPLDHLVRETINYVNIRAAAAKHLCITATNWSLGETETFSNHEMTDDLGPAIVKASASIPGFLPVQYVGAQPYVDGGVLLNTPLLPAIQVGANVLHVITLNPQIRKIPRPELSNTLETAWRQQVVAWVAAVEKGLREAWYINLNRELAQEGLNRLKASASNEPLGLEVTLQKYVKDYKAVEVYLYRPGSDLGGPLGLLNFDRDRIQRLIERGFSDAVNYRKTAPSEAWENPTYIPDLPLTYQTEQQMRTAT
jgi:predicted acylesterase/phospholipase RssA